MDNQDKTDSVKYRRKRGRPVQSFEQHYTIADACDLLGIKRRTLYDWIKKGVIPYYVKTPGGMRIPASALCAFSESRRIVTRPGYESKEGNIESVDE